MKRHLAALAALAIAACAHGEGASTDKRTAPALVGPPVRTALQPMTVGADMASSSIHTVFEQLLCNRLFDLNQKEVVCPDQINVVLENSRQRAVIGGEVPTLEAILATMDAPRRVGLSASKVGENVMVSILVQDAKGATLGRSQVVLKPDGSDLGDRVEEAALAILQPK